VVEAAGSSDRGAGEVLSEFARLNFPREWPPERRAEARAQWEAARKKEAKKARKKVETAKARGTKDAKTEGKVAKAKGGRKWRTASRGGARK